jgi:lipopolysaccharide/colanic/teichoic acid biosynthesis glycosyltransferase
MKRVFDFIFSAIGIVLLTPLCVLIAAAVRYEDGGPIFYRGWRVGRWGEPFQVLKFRSMVVNAEKMGGSSTAEDDVRLTNLGRFLRKHKLDELPQLWNVLIGDMSLVGPRPQVQWAVDLYTEDERALLNLRPGMTDYASLVFRDEGAILKGSVDPDRTYLEKIHPAKVSLGLTYLSHGSRWADLKIIVATLGALVGADPRWCLPGGDGVRSLRSGPKQPR